PASIVSSAATSTSHPATSAAPSACPDPGFAQSGAISWRCERGRSCAATGLSRKERRNGGDDPSRRERIRPARTDAALPRGLGLRGAERARRRRGPVRGHGPPYPDRSAPDRRRHAGHERVRPRLPRVGAAGGNEGPLYLWVRGRLRGHPRRADRLGPAVPAEAVLAGRIVQEGGRDPQDSWILGDASELRTAAPPPSEPRAANARPTNSQARSAGVPFECVRAAAPRTPALFTSCASSAAPLPASSCSR